MTLDEFNEKWDGSTDQDKNKWIATRIMNWSKVDSGWIKNRSISSEIYHELPDYLSYPCLSEVVDEVCYNYELLIHREKSYGISYAQIGHNLLTPNKRILCECTDTFMNIAIAKVVLMFSHGLFAL